MTNTYFGFMKPPFSKERKKEEVFVWKQFDELSSRLNYFLKEGGIFLMTGEIGSGKTTALKYFTESLLPARYLVIYLNYAFMNRKDLYRTLLQELHQMPPYHLSDARNLLKRHLLELKEVKKITPIIILDEAQNIPGFLLEEIRLLTNYDYDSKTPFSFILTGHKLLKNRMTAYENEALNQRINLRYHLSGLNLEESCSYIHHCLKIAGSTSALFDDKTLMKIFELSKGIPRKINNICNLLLLACQSGNLKLIDVTLLDKIHGELE